jgi:hypothetical protein
LELDSRPTSAQAEKLSKAPSRRWFSAGYVPADFVLVEHLAHRRQKPGERPGKLGIISCGVGEHHQLLANQVVDAFFVPKRRLIALVALHCSIQTFSNRIWAI